MEAIVLFKNKYTIKTYSQPQGGWFISVESMEITLCSQPWDEFIISNKGIGNTNLGKVLMVFRTWAKVHDMYTNDINLSRS